MLSMQHHPTLLRFFVLASVAILACVELIVAETTHPSSEDATDQHYLRTLTAAASSSSTPLEERAGEEGAKAFRSTLINLWKTIGDSEFVKAVLPSLHVQPANELKVAANQFFVEFGVGNVAEDLFESKAFSLWSDRIQQAFNHINFDDEAKIMVEVLIEHNANLLIKSIAKAKKTTGLTATVKGLESALMNKCLDDMSTNMRLVDLYMNPLIQIWYLSSKESAIVQLQRKVDATTELRKQVDSAVVEAKTSSILARRIAKDVKAIFKAEKKLAAQSGDSDIEIVASNRLQQWLAIVQKRKLNSMMMLIARLRASSHEEVLALCESAEIPHDVRRGLQNAVFARLEGEAFEKMTNLLKKSDTRYKEDLVEQWFAYLKVKYPELQDFRELIMMEYKVPDQ